MRTWGGRLLALFICSVLVLLSETSDRTGGSGVFAFASGDFALREKNLKNFTGKLASVSVPLQLARVKSKRALEEKSNERGVFL